jgi:hypothetical protein
VWRQVSSFKNFSVRWYFFTFRFDGGGGVLFLELEEGVAEADMAEEYAEGWHNC